jgi:putative peptidoglycan lipid II flippase
MGPAQASDVFQGVGTVRGPRTGARTRPRGSIFLRELTVPQATAVLAAAFLGSALLGAVRQVLFNAEFGAGDDASAYYAAFRLPDTLFSLVAGGALSSAMIPVLLSTRLRGGEAAGRRLARMVLTALLAFVTAVVIIGEIAAPWFVTGLLAPGFDERTSELAVNLTRIMLLQPLILAAGSVAIALLNSRNQFVLTALSAASHNVALIAGVAVARVDPGAGIYAPAVAVVAGAVLQVLILVPGFRQAGIRPAWAPGDPALRDVVRLLIPNGLSVGVGYAGFIIDTAFASTAREAEAIGAILNAWLLVGLPISLLGQAVGQAAFPRMAAASAHGDYRRFRRVVGMSLGAVVLLSVPALIGLVALGRSVVRVLFEHGEFDTAAGDVTGDVLRIYALALPAYVATEVISRALIAMRDTRTPLFTNAAQLLARIAIVAALVDREGAIAIPIAFALTASVETVVLGSILLWRLRRRARYSQLA